MKKLLALVACTALWAGCNRSDNGAIGTGGTGTPGSGNNRGTATETGSGRPVITTTGAPAGTSGITTNANPVHGETNTGDARGNNPGTVPGGNSATQGSTAPR